MWLSWSLIAFFFILPLGQIGLFDDGVFYGSISRNLATEPKENPWQLVVSLTLDDNFNGHPPFMFWLQSLFFRILGDYFWVEKLFSLVCLLFSLWAIKLVWNLLLPQQKMYAYLPVFLWLLTPMTWWSFGNNMLENLLTALDLWAVFFIFKHIQAHKWFSFNLFLATALLIAASLTKGFVGLYPLSVLAAYWFFDKKSNFYKVFIASAFILLGVILFYTFLIWYDENAKTFLLRYISLQIAPSLSGQSAATSRFLILQKIIEENLIIVLVLFLLFLYQKIAKFKVEKIDFSRFKMFIFLAFSATLPMMISPKQLGFYIVPALPLFALAAAVLVLPIISHLRRQQTELNYLFLAFKLFIISCFIGFYVNFGTIGRNKEILNDVLLINKKIAAHTVVRLQDDLYKSWNLHGYLYRFGYINLLCDDSRAYRYWLVKKNTDFYLSDYEKMNLNTQLYDIWENKNIAAYIKK
jgi:Dolichyl-phosphate-mannose-protein mannosyltransferase